MCSEPISAAGSRLLDSSPVDSSETSGRTSEPGEPPGPPQPDQPRPLDLPPQHLEDEAVIEEVCCAAGPRMI